MLPWMCRRNRVSLTIEMCRHSWLGMTPSDGLRKVAAMDAPQFEGCLPGGRLEAGWRQAGGVHVRIYHFLEQIEQSSQPSPARVHIRIYTFLAELEAGWRQAGGRLEGVHMRIYTFLVELEAGWRAFTQGSTHF